MANGTQLPDDRDLQGLDITGAEQVEVKIRADGKVLWVNTPQGCVLRICRIESIEVIDERHKPIHIDAPIPRPISIGYEHHPNYVVQFGQRPEKGYVVKDEHGRTVFETDTRSEAIAKAAELND